MSLQSKGLLQHCNQLEMKVCGLLFQALGDAMTGITNHAKKGELERFCDSVGGFSGAVCGLTEAASQVSVSLYCIQGGGGGFCDSVGGFSGAVCDLTEAASQVSVSFSPHISPCFHVHGDMM